MLGHMADVPVGQAPSARSATPNADEVAAPQQAPEVRLGHVEGGGGFPHGHGRLAHGSRPPAARERADLSRESVGAPLDRSHLARSALEVDHQALERRGPEQPALAGADDAIGSQSGRGPHGWDCGHSVANQCCTSSAPFCCSATTLARTVDGTLGTGDASHPSVMQGAVRRQPLIDSLIDELDGVLAGLQNARLLAQELRQSAEAARRAARTDVDDAALALSPSLRFTGMSVSETAERLGLGEEQVRRLLRRGFLAGIPFGGHVGWRLPRSAVEAIAEEWDAQRLAQESARRTTRSKAPVRRGKS